MAIDPQRIEEADYLADKLGTLIKESRAGAQRSEKINIALQIAQFLVIGVVGTVLSFYADSIKSQQQAQNEVVLQAFRDRETKAAQAKVVQDFMTALFDTQNENRPKVAILIIKNFIDERFALEVGKLVNTPGVNAGLDQIQAQPQASAPPVSPASTNSSKTGWVYLGSYDSGWKTQYFEFPSDKTPTDLENGKVVTHVKTKVGAANFRSEPPGRGKPEALTVLGRLRPQDMLQVDRVEAVPDTTFMWAHATLMAR